MESLNYFWSIVFNFEVEIMASYLYIKQQSKKFPDYPLKYINVHNIF